MEQNKTTNPVFRSVQTSAEKTQTYTSTYTGVITKTGILILVAVLSAIFASSLIKEGNFDQVLTLLIISTIVTLISVFIALLVPRVVMPFSILYSLGEGFMLGTLTVLLELAYPGSYIGLTAIVGTVSIFIVMLALYSFKIFRATSKFKKIMYGVLGGILFFSLVSFIISLINPNFGGFFANSPGLAIGVSVFLIIYGAFMLILDFDRAQQIVESGADKRYEWTVALGLMITIVWIYVEILRLAAILASRD